MGNKNTSFREKETKVDLKSRSSFRKNRKSLKKSITAPLTSYTPQLDERKGVNFNRSLPGSPHLPKASPAPSNLSKHSPSSGKLEVKIFRSYTKLNDSDRKKHFLDETPTNIRVYKRSNNGSDASLSTTRLASRSYSLPRDMCCKEHRTSTTSQSIENFSSVRRVRRSILNSSTGSRLNSVCAPSPRSYRGLCVCVCLFFFVCVFVCVRFFASMIYLVCLSVWFNYNHGRNFFQLYVCHSR